jgi:hypothetical protein
MKQKILKGVRQAFHLEDNTTAKTDRPTLPAAKKAKTN